MKDLIYSQARLIDSLPARILCRYMSIDLSAENLFLLCRIHNTERALTAIPAEYCRGLNNADHKMPVGIEPTIQGLLPCAFIHTWLRHHGMKTGDLRCAGLLSEYEINTSVLPLGIPPAVFRTGKPARGKNICAVSCTFAIRFIILSANVNNCFHHALFLLCFCIIQ